MLSSHSCFIGTIRLVALLGILTIVPGTLVGQAPAAPLRVAIVGLEHGHVEGFLGQLPKHTDVELVGIADADPELVARYEKKYSLRADLFFKTQRT